LVLNILIKKGKNMRDQHFSIISRVLEKTIFKKQTSLKSAQDVVDALNENSIYINEGGNNSESLRNNSIAILFNPPNRRTVNRNKRIIKDLNCYYNLQNVLKDGEFEFFSSIFSDRTSLIAIDSVLEDIIENFKNTVDPENNVVERISNNERSNIIQNNLTNKKRLIELIFESEKKKKLNEHEKLTQSNFFRFLFIPKRILILYDNLNLKFNKL
jgi:hypothetical protein